MRILYKGNIESDFGGRQGNTKYKLTNGQM